jgi:proline iminopeptidase
MKKILNVACFLAFTAIIILCFFILKPTDFDVATAKERTGTKHWQLKTGSVIAYTLITAKGTRKPHPLIYLHGGPGAGVTNKEVETLANLSEEGYDVYLYDQAGCGLSGRLKNIGEYSAERHKQDLDEIIKEINADKVILIAQSWGSILSLSYMAENPDKVAKLIITAPANIQPARTDLKHVPPPDSIHFKPYYTDKRYQLISGNLRARAVIYAAKNYNKKTASDKEADKLLTYLTTELNRSMVCDTSHAVIAEGTEGFYAHYMTLNSLAAIQDQRPVLKKLNIPVYIMKGECDIQPWGYTAEYLEVFPHAHFRLIRDAGHNIFIEQPVRYINTIRDFLKE